MIKVLTIIGARPQFIKAATVSREINKLKDIEEVILHTGQHFDDNMSQVFFEEMNIPKPDYHFDISGGTHGYQTGNMLIKIEEVLQKEEPEVVLVYGDTNSTLAGALSASKLHIPVVHVEAGLRSFNKKMPEEINRILTDHVSDLLFTATDDAIKNLVHEGISREKIHQVGDVMYDAALFYLDKANKQKNIITELGLISNNYVLATIHRAENTDKKSRLIKIFKELDQIAEAIKVVVPLHPRTKAKMEQYQIETDNIFYTDPLGYLDMVLLESNSKMIITDSGGVQKEAFFHKKPCITLRDETEWVELVDSGFNFLWKDGKKMKNLYDEVNSKHINPISNFYGDGNAAYLIVKKIIDLYEKQDKF